MALSAALTVIVSTYERPRELALALRGVERAAGAVVGGLEVVVADDGSGPSTAAEVERFASRVSFPVLHARQEHQGFRLAAARNLAVRRAHGDVLVFLDGDCVIQPPALALHQRRVRPGRAHTGARVFLTQEETRSVLGGSALEEVEEEVVRRGRPALIRTRLKDLLYSTLRLKPRPKLVAANCAIHRLDLEAVNGFDERFVGWGLEDDDLIRRLRRRGVRLAGGTLDCLAVHLFHPVHESHRPSVRGSPNDRYYRRGSFLTRCRRGLEARPLEAMRWEVLGEPAASLSPLLERLPTSGAAPEASLVFPGSRRGRARGEVVIRVSPREAAAGPEALRRLLEDRL